uniref:Uncharacterized protein n=1 Tax=Triticum urartu TaxID=4572 RepID=A0A8R7K259_TRIUA
MAMAATRRRGRPAARAGPSLSGRASAEATADPDTCPSAQNREASAALAISWASTLRMQWLTPFRAQI